MIEPDETGISPPKKIKITGRRLARDFAMRGVYQWLMNKSEIVVIDTEIRKQTQFRKVDDEHYRKLLFQSLKEFEQLSAILSPFLDRAQNQVSVVEQAVLIVGTCELKNHLDVPFRVVIREALKMQNKYGSEEGYRYVNGVLDRVAHQLRRSEYQEPRLQEDNLSESEQDI